MTRRELNDEYFEWMFRLIFDDGISSRKSKYNKLLHQLHDIEFTYTIDLDGNRAEDGIELRYRFGDEMKHPQPMIARFLDDRPCSILEMMVALAVRCEEHIMEDADFGDRTGVWFRVMLESLGLDLFEDIWYDSEAVADILDRFLNREYDRDGKGGLFRIRNCTHDLRTTDIWYQMNWYLNDIS